VSGGFLNITGMETLLGVSNFIYVLFSFGLGIFLFITVFRPAPLSLLSNGYQGLFPWD